MSLRNTAAMRGIAVALLCQCAACVTPGPEPTKPRSDTLIAQASVAARLAYERGDFGQARQLYRQALTRARAVDDAGLAADAAYNLAISEIALGNYAVAEQLLPEAVYDAGRAASATDDILLLRAKVAYLREQLPEALAIASVVADSRAALALRLQAMLLRGHIFCERGELAPARSELQRVQGLGAAADAKLPPAIRADRAKLEGMIARLEGNLAAAAGLFDSEAELLRRAHRYRDMGYALARVADAYLAAGQPDLAADRYYLAARSLDARGEHATAQAFLASSLAAADKAGKQNARERALSLLDEISRRAGP